MWKLILKKMGLELVAVALYVGAYWFLEDYPDLSLTLAGAAGCLYTIRHCLPEDAKGEKHDSAL